MNFWDQQFAVAGYKYGTQPNAFLVAQAQRLPPAAEVLLPGDGEGRNSVWLAQQGHCVTAVDMSRVGLDKTERLAAERGVTVRTVCADLAEWQPEAGTADAVVLTFLHLPPALRPVVHRRLCDALRPQGLLILEAFHPDQLPLTSGGPKDPAMLYTLDMLRADFAGLEELHASETETQLDEGPGHQGLARVTRWVGRRP